ncbi:MAG TPA: DUF3551 domain-containing protein [Pseudolabrys sp.]|jgi:hypothetical protein|nr:DUF3551 domain-containing protein [Pseudolabrys sp.]
MRQTLALAAILAAFAMAAPAASAATAAHSGKFCLNGAGNEKNCSFETMAACEKSKDRTRQETCAANTGGTTGSGMSNSSTMQPAKKQEPNKSK